MKRWHAVLLTAGLLFSLCACTTQEEGSAQSPPPVQSAQQQEQTQRQEPTQPEQQPADTETTQQQSEAAQGTPVVYMTQEISPEGLMAAYQALQWEPQGRVAVKLSTGEPPASNYLRPELIAGLVQSLDGTIVECNTAYGGSRAETAMHYQVAEDHGFTAIADFQILDEEGSMTLPVQGGTRLNENYVGAAFDDYDSYLVLSHFKGHSHGWLWRGDQKYLDRPGLQRGQGLDSQRRHQPHQSLGRRSGRLLGEPWRRPANRSATIWEIRLSTSM